MLGAGMERAHSILSHVLGAALEVVEFLPLHLTGCSEPRCLNGGTCRQALYFSDFVCQCPDGFMGKRCEVGECIGEGVREALKP
jgi:hypothetical protein